MTLRSRMMAIFPAIALGADLAALIGFVFAPSPARALLLVFAIYGLPLLTFRVLVFFWPVRPEKGARLDAPVYSPWWGAHQAQLPFETFPFFEGALRLVPGLYSAWLRAWGSSVGKRVYWPPTVRVMDRGLVHIGDGVIFGHHVECVSHFVTKRAGHILLFVQTITIGHEALVGTHVCIGPGVRIGRGAVLGAFSQFGPHVSVANGTRVPPGTALIARVHVDDATFAKKSDAATR